MIHRMIDVLTRASERNQLRDMVLKLLQENEQLRLENAKLRAENRQIRRRLADAELRLVRRAQADALLIGGLHFAELPTSRRACYDVGLSERRWMRAMALLRVGRVAQDGRIGVDAPEDFERGVRVAVERVKRDGIDTLRHRMPLCRR